MFKFVAAPLFFGVFALGAPLRHVNCSGTAENIVEGQESWYQFAFSGYNSSVRTGSSTLVFESMLVASLVGGLNAVDASEALVAIKRLEDHFYGNSSISVSESVEIWEDMWLELAAIASKDAKAASADNNLEGAARANLRAWAYGLFSERFSDHLDPSSLATYNSSITAFRLALTQARALGSSSAASRCEAVEIPYTDESGSWSLHGYWCRSALAQVRGTVIGLTGYDGTAELSVQSIGVPATAHGYDVLVFEGPGQGSVARFLRLLFRPDWEFVVNQVLTYVTKTLGADPKKVILWGESFGGELAPRAFSHMDSFAALVANGGVMDFFQATFCSLPDALQPFYYNDRHIFNKYADSAIETDIGSLSAFRFGTLGFNATTFGDLFDAFQHYYQDNIAGIQQRPVIVYNPTLDDLVGNQSEIFFSQLPTPLNSKSAILTLNAARGGALHGGLGSTSVVPETILASLDRIFPLPNASPKKHHSTPGTSGTIIGLSVALGLVSLIALWAVGKLFFSTKSSFKDRQHQDEDYVSLQ